MDSTVLCRSEDGHCTDYGVTVELCWLHAPTSRGGEGATEKEFSILPRDLGDLVRLQCQS